MSGAFVNSILVVLLIALHSIMAFHSNVHEKMTRAQRLAVFGSEDSVPEYQVFSTSMSGARRRRKTDETIKLKIEIANKTINLNLKPTKGYLATRYTPVWLAKTDEHAFKNIRYDPLPMAMADIGSFKMYHDVENDAAIVTYTHPTEGDVIEGIVTQYYAIRSLPMDLMKKTLTEGREITQKQFTKKRSTTPDVDEGTDYFAVIKTRTAPNHIKLSSPVDPNDLRREKRAGGRGKQRNVSKTVYPKILVVLDYNAIRNHTITQALRFMLAFWNGVDLMHKVYDQPKVHLNIAGIIIAGDDRATPYLPSTTSIDASERGVINDALLSMGLYFFEERVRFPMKAYDMIIGMTTNGMCPIAKVIEVHCSPYVYGQNFRSACMKTRRISRMKAISSTGLVGYNWEFAGTFVAADVTANILGADIRRWENFNSCYWNGRYFTLRDDGLDYLYKNCTRRYLSQSLLSAKTGCLFNKSSWIETVGEVLPGRWMSLNGQCRNKGYAKGCRLENKSMCEAQGCQDEGSLVCTPTGGVPLWGSECETDKYCSAKHTCVPIGQIQRSLIKTYLSDNKMFAFFSL